MVTVNPRPAWLGRSVLAFVLLAAGSSPGWAQQIQVSSADPNTASQGTINLDVLVKGRGFKPGARARWLVTGTTEPGGVTVNSTTVLSGTEIRANITVAAGAVVSFYDIDVMNADGRTGKGTERFSVTQGKPNAEPPPDPAIAYIDSSQLMVMNADGTNKRVVWGAAREVSRAPDWSPDATQLVFVRQPARKSSGIFLVNLDGSGLCQLATLRETSNLFMPWVRPAWSPLPLADGQYWIIYQDWTGELMSNGAARHDLYAVRASCANPGTPVRLTNDDEDAWFGWSRLADRLVVSYGDYASHVVYDVVISGGRPTLINPVTYTEWGASILAPSWAKDRDRLIFGWNNSAGGSYDLFVAAPGQAAVQITSTPEMGGETYPDWSPDGSEVVFVAMGTETEPPAIWKLGYVVGADGTGSWIRTQKLLDTLGTPMPRWRRCSVCP